MYTSYKKRNRHQHCCSYLTHKHYDQNLPNQKNNYSISFWLFY